MRSWGTTDKSFSINSESHARQIVPVDLRPPLETVPSASRGLHPKFCINSISNLEMTRTGARKGLKENANKNAAA